MKVCSPGAHQILLESFCNGISKDDTAFEVVVEHLDKVDDLWCHAVCSKDLPQTFTMYAVELLLKINKVCEKWCVPF